MSGTSAIATLDASPGASEVEARAARTMVVDVRGTLAAEYAHRCGGRSLDAKSFVRGVDLTGFNHVVLFLPERPSPLEPAMLNQLRMAIAGTEARVVVVSSYRAHFHDAKTLAAERSIVDRLLDAGCARVTIVRTGNVLHDGSPINGALRRLAAWYPLVPSRLRSCFLEKRDLFATIDDLLARESGRGSRVLTLLGRNLPLRELLADRAAADRILTCVVLLATLLAWLGMAHILGLAFAAAARLWSSLRQWHFDTLTPTSTAELLALLNSYNYRHVAIAGYNTGVVHFGWKWPGRTVVKTVGCGRLIRIQGESVVVDAGVTLKRTIETLNCVGRELCVVPNYSYISMGTPFFVPVHGSACVCSTLGETIEKVWLYDARADRIKILRRGEGEFAEMMYRPAAGVVVLRLKYRVQPRRRFVVERAKLGSPTADEVWQLFTESDAANIELRKSRAVSPELDVYRYYPAAAADADTLDVARDTVGRLWDRLEENALTSYLFHTLVRRFGFHVELFLDESEFGVFWRAHTRLPLSKIQLRFVRADHLPHSPCGSRDCISADLFMPRSKSSAFLEFIREQLPHARFNPGKHSL